MTAVAPNQRHTKAHRCPICGGADGDPRGKERRCSGFTSTDGSYVHCSREELAGPIEQNGAQLFAHRMNGSCKCGVQHGPDLRPSYVSPVKTLVCTYDYTDERGAVLFHVDRFRLPTGEKTFRQRQPGGVHDTKGVRRVLYRLPEVIRAVACGETIYICEGEKDCDAMAAAGFTATCNPGGAGMGFGQVAELARQVLAGADVVVIADADKEGRPHAIKVAAALQGAARQVTILEPLAPYKDATALLDAGRTLADLVPLQLDDVPAEQPTTEGRGEPATIWAPELAQPLPPLEWISEGLTITAGRATVFAGEGGSRKSWFAMALQMCGADDRQLLSKFGLRRGLRSVYFDFEQTERVTRERYQALARGHEISLPSLEHRLGYRWRPVPSLAPRTDADRQRVVDELSWHTEGLDLAIIDSVRACSPGVEENSVFASGPFDIATEVSQRTGVAFVFIDHAGKPRDDAGSGRTRKHSQRGHSSKIDAGQTLLVFSAAKGEPTLVTCERSQAAAEEDWPADFQFTLAKANGGLRLQEIGMPEKVEKTAEDRFEKEVDAALAVLVAKPGLTLDEWRESAGKGAGPMRAIRDALERTGRTENRGSAKYPKWFPKGAA